MVIVYQAFDKNISAFGSSVLSNKTGSDVFRKALVKKGTFYLELTVQ